ncbi:hypothetical protein BJ742DRAFT_157281 [Cladochytrium replicatum]|nr:hypothetical protein BJ742DRAFT_157281 [Cladochytrium replicatum]
MSVFPVPALHPNMATTRIPVKAELRADSPLEQRSGPLRRFFVATDSPAPFADLEATLRELFSVPKHYSLRLVYLDVDGDEIDFHTDAELRDAAYFAGSALRVRVQIIEKKETVEADSEVGTTSKLAESVVVGGLVGSGSTVTTTGSISETPFALAALQSEARVPDLIDIGTPFNPFTDPIVPERQPDLATAVDNNAFIPPVNEQVLSAESTNPFISPPSAQNESANPFLVDTPSRATSLSSGIERLAPSEASFDPRMTSSSSVDLSAFATPEAPFGRSPVSHEMIKLTLTNFHTTPITYSWINFDGVEIPYGHVEPSEETTQRSYDGHIWIAREKESGKWLMRFVTSKDAPFWTVMATDSFSDGVLGGATGTPLSSAHDDTNTITSKRPEKISGDADPAASISSSSASASTPAVAAPELPPPYTPGADAERYTKAAAKRPPLNVAINELHFHRLLLQSAIIQAIRALFTSYNGTSVLEPGYLRAVITSAIEYALAAWGRVVGRGPSSSATTASSSAPGRAIDNGGMEMKSAVKTALKNAAGMTQGIASSMSESAKGLSTRVKTVLEDLSSDDRYFDERWEHRQESPWVGRWMPLGGIASGGSSSSRGKNFYVDVPEELAMNTKSTWGRKFDEDILSTSSSSSDLSSSKPKEPKDKGKGRSVEEDVLFMIPVEQDDEEEQYEAPPALPERKDSELERGVSLFEARLSAIRGIDRDAMSQSQISDAANYAQFEEDDEDDEDDGGQALDGALRSAGLYPSVEDDLTRRMVQREEEESVSDLNSEAVPEDLRMLASPSPDGFVIVKKEDSPLP